MQSFREKGIRILSSIPGMLLFLLCLFLFNTPEELTFTAFMMRFADRTMYVLAGLLLILYALVKKEPLKDGLFLSSFVFCAFAWITTIANHGETLTVFNNYLICGVGTVLLFSLFFDIDVKKFVWIAFIYYLLITILNNVTAIVYMKSPVGEPTWFSHRPIDHYAIFCGNHNLTLVYVLITYALGVFVAENYQKGIWALNTGLLAFSMYVGHVTDCKTELVIFPLVFLFSIIGLLAKKNKAAEWIPKILNEYVFAVLNIAAAAGLYLVTKGIITQIPEEMARLNNRDRVWKFAAEAISERPLFGNGLQVPLAEGYNYSHVHSIFLEIPYLTGIAGTLIFIGLFIIMVFMIRKTPAKGLRYVFSFVFSLFFTASLMEYYPVQGMLTLFAIIYYGCRAAAREQN